MVARGNSDLVLKRIGPAPPIDYLNMESDAFVIPRVRSSSSPSLSSNTIFYAVVHTTSTLNGSTFLENLSFGFQSIIVSISIGNNFTSLFRSARFYNINLDQYLDSGYTMYLSCFYIYLSFLKKKIYLLLFWFGYEVRI